jgi:hypothetical protein
MPSSNPLMQSNLITNNNTIPKITKIVKHPEAKASSFMPFELLLE